MASDRISAGGIVLCGGQSKRMGRPKAWLPFGGETMLERVVRLLSEVVHPIVVVAAPVRVCRQDCRPYRGKLTRLTCHPATCRFCGLPSFAEWQTYWTITPFVFRMWMDFIILWPRSIARELSTR